MNIPDEYVPLIVKGLEHYYAYTRAVQRDDSRHQKAADWLQAELIAKIARPGQIGAGSGGPASPARVSALTANIPCRHVANPDQAVRRPVRHVTYSIRSSPARDVYTHLKLTMPAIRRQTRLSGHHRAEGGQRHRAHSRAKHGRFWMPGAFEHSDPTLANPVAGGHPGALEFATSDPNFYQSAYPYAFGPRLGVAYQIDPKTVFRGGWGINYQFVQAAAGSTISSPGAYNVQANSPSYIPTADQYVNDQVPGFIQTPVYPITNPYQCPLPGATSCGTNTVTAPDSQQNRPPRINQYSLGLQREITRNMLIEASYVGNHAVWLTPFGTNLGRLSQLSPQYLATLGLYPIPGTGPAGTNNETARALLSDPLSSVAVQQFLLSQGITNGGLPYSGFPTSTTLANALVPFPQFGAIEPSGAPTGASKYDSLQVKLTKRFSHGFQAGGSYTWAKGYSLVQSRQDYFNPASSMWNLQNIPPQDLNFNATYTVPRASFLPKWANQITKDWQLGWFSNYQSGTFLAPPTSTTLNYLPSEDIPVPGQSFYAPGVNPNNLGTYNPWTTQVLNPNAWEQCPTNSTCPAAASGPFGNTATVYYSNFRAPRTPTENANIARNFRIKERMNLQIRGEFINIFNRTLMPAPSTSNPQSPAVKNALGYYTSGFGVIDTYFAPNTAPALPTGSTSPYLESRQGTMIMRFSF